MYRGNTRSITAASDMTSDPNAAALKSVPMFAELREDDLARIASLLHRRRHRKGAMIHLQGDRLAALCLIGAGRVKLVVTGEDGKDLVLSTRGVGDFFGEQSLFDSQPLGMSIIAMEDVELLLLPQGDFHRMLRELPDIAFGLLRILLHRLRQADMRLSAVALLDVPQRVAHILLELADENDGRVITEPVTHQFLSELVGATRESVSRSMSQLTQQGVISTGRETAVISERRQAASGNSEPSTLEVGRRIIRIEDRAALERAAGRLDLKPGSPSS